MIGLAGKVAVITGAGSGVGRGMALAFARAGAAVVVAAHHGPAGEAVASEIVSAGGRGLGVACDVTRVADLRVAVAVAVDAFGYVDTFVHNAVSARSSEPVELEDASIELWQEHAAVSIRALLYGSQAVHPQLRDHAGSMLVLTSPAGIQGSDRLSFYAAVKGAQRGFVKSLAREWGPEGIRVNGLAPLAVTPALDDAFRHDPQMEDRLRSVIPSGRLGDPESDIGPAAAFLCSDSARYITGQTLVVSGGRFTAL